MRGCRPRVDTCPCFPLPTGGAGGIGIATTQAFLDRGDTVVLVDLKQEALDKALEILGGHSDRVDTLVADVTKEEDVESYVSTTVQKHGRIDVFHNNAGIAGPNSPIVDLDASTIRTILEINTTGVFLGMKHVARQMTEQRDGVIINTASNAAYIGSAGMAGYIASKHAVAGLTKRATLELVEAGVRVNAVAPAAIASRFTVSRASSGMVGADGFAFTPAAAASSLMRRAMRRSREVTPPASWLISVRSRCG